MHTVIGPEALWATAVPDPFCFLNSHVPFAHYVAQGLTTGVGLDTQKHTLYFLSFTLPYLMLCEFLFYL